MKRKKTERRKTKKKKTRARERDVERKTAKKKMEKKEKNMQLKIATETIIVVIEEIFFSCFRVPSRTWTLLRRETFYRRENRDEQKARVKLLQMEKTSFPDRFLS